jgi:hypothetical protein
MRMICDEPKCNVNNAQEAKEMMLQDLIKAQKYTSDSETFYLYLDPSYSRLLHLVGGSQSERFVTSPLFNPLQDGWRCISFWFVSTFQLYQRSIKLRVLDEEGKEFNNSLWNYNASVTNITYVQIPLPRVNAYVKVRQNLV